MPAILPFLQGDAAFDPEATRAMSTARRRMPDAQGERRRAREVIAMRIIDLARRGERDPFAARSGTEGGGVPSGSPDSLRNPGLYRVVAPGFQRLNCRLPPAAYVAALISAIPSGRCNCSACSVAGTAAGARRSVRGVISVVRDASRPTYAPGAAHRHRKARRRPSGVTVDWR
jgi:hypothetical protein